jgi:hypothetical protein
VRTHRFFDAENHNHAFSTTATSKTDNRKLETETHRRKRNFLSFGGLTKEPSFELFDHDITTTTSKRATTHWN